MRNALFERGLFERHSRDELRAWARSLLYFRFWRAVGGHSGDDGDVLVVALRAQTEPDLLGVLGALGIAVEYLPPDAPQPEPGVSYTSPEYLAFPSKMRDFPHIRQPGHIHLAGHKAHAWVHGGQLEITIHDQESVYDVTQAAVESARQVEPLLALLADKIIDPPRDDRHCICPKFYPEFWQGS